MITTPVVRARLAWIRGNSGLESQSPDCLFLGSRWLPLALAWLSLAPALGGSLALNLHALR